MSKNNPNHWLCCGGVKITIDGQCKICKDRFEEMPPKIINKTKASLILRMKRYLPHIKIEDIIIPEKNVF